ncbi:centrosomal protein of 290 kDa-like isoform X2 [Planococcus citri]|uniref:centrosomal protein of 290 kDa-like isoform X2 n=1 Tax=Planococcus citri TaxID=170843 RepID=UPI0031F73059
MALTVLEKYLPVAPEDLTEEEKDNLFPLICSLDISLDVDTDNFIKLFQIAQEILRFKGEQVESLVNELDNLATKLGEEEAKRSQNFIEIEDLRSSSTRTDKDGTSSDTDDYQRKLVKMEIQNDRLLSELQEKEQELMNEKKEIEKLSIRITSLEEENRVLKSELQSTQQELTSNASVRMMTEEQEYPSTEKYQELMELLRQKNKHITQLLNDIEDIERENNSLREKLSIVRDELAEGAEQMSKLSMERISLSTNVDELKSKVLLLEQENLGLRSQINELVEEKETRNKQFETNNTHYETKLQQLKEILQKRDSELSSFKLQHSVNSSFNRKLDDSGHLTQLSNLSKTLAEREKQIVELQQQLKQATVDLNESTQLLEEQKKILQSKFDKNLESNLLKQLKKKLEQAENRVVVLDSKVKHAEEDSLKKAQEVTELIIQLREYESGTYGLEDAMVRIKELQKQKQVRDNQIEQLVQNLNQLQDEANLLEQENQILKDRVGISHDEQIIADDFARRNRDRRSKLSELTEQLEKTNDELLSVKLDNRELKKQITSLMTELNFYRLKEPASIDTPDAALPSGESILPEPSTALQILPSEPAAETGLDEKFQEIVDENESLRKGSSTIQIESETLEQLLEALDSRHVNGWYQPGMRLQAHIHQLYGVNKTLREELHICRSREDDLHLQLHEAFKKIEQLEESGSQVRTITFPEQRIPSPKLKKAISCSESLLKSSRELEAELDREKETCKNLQTRVNNLQNSLDSLQQQMEKINEQYDLDKESWYHVKVSMQQEIDNIKNNEMVLQLKVSEFEKSLEILKEDPNEIKKAYVENTFRISSLKVDLQQVNRKYQAMAEVENKTRQEKNKISEELYLIKQLKSEEILQLTKENDRLSNELNSHIKQLDQYVNISEYEKITIDFNQLTIKHRETLHKQILIGSDKDKLVTRLQNEVASLSSQKLELEVILKQTYEENRHLRSTTSTVDVSEQLIALTKQLASTELDIITKRQYSDHMSRMYELTKEQLTETENRCKFLEDQLSQAIESNSLLQKNEAELREKILKVPSNVEFDEIMMKLKNAESNMNTLSAQKKELEEVANIAQDQVKSLEQYNRCQDFEYDSLQRRILELQSLSDEKMIIDRLTKELLHLRGNGIVNNDQIETYKDKVIKLEAEILQTKMKLSESENEYHRLKKESNNKIRSMYSIIYELQKRYLNSFPLIKEELCFENIIRCKEEQFALTSIILDMKLPTVSILEETESDESLTKSPNWEYKSKFKIQDINMRLINEGLQNKIQIYAERLDRQDKLICRLEQEMNHADEQCREFLLYWSPHSNIRLSTEHDDSVNNKSTQTSETIVQPQESYSVYDSVDKIKQANVTISELNSRLKSMDDDLRKTRDQLASLMMELKEKESIISVKEKEILSLQKTNNERENFDEHDSSEADGNSIKKLALKTTVDSLQNIIHQKEETIERLQSLLKKNREEHYQSTLELQRELKGLQESTGSKEQSYRLKTKLDAAEKITNDKRSFFDSYLTKIHKLEDDLNEANEKIEQLSSQLATSNQQAELWSLTAEERLKTLQNMKHELDAKHVGIPASASSESGKISYSSLLQMVKEKTEEIERLNQAVEDYKKRLGSGEKLPGYRDRLKNELERYKRKSELYEQKEKEDKAEIQRLKNQLISRPQSSRKKEILITPKEEQLMKKIKLLEEQLDDFVMREKKWKETRKSKCDEEVEKWQNRKRYQQNYEKLRQQFKDQSVHLESLKVNNERLKETIIRLEKERFALESKLKSAKNQSSNLPLIEELQKNNSRLEEELRILRKTCEISGSGSLTDVIEAQDRKIMALELAQKGDCALAEEIERLNERKSQLQKYNIHLEEENMRLKLEIKEFKSKLRIPDDTNEGTSKMALRSDSRSGDEDTQKILDMKGNKRKNGDLEKAVLVLRRVVEKLQAENKRLHNSKINQLQDRNYVEKLQMEVNNLQGNYLDAIEKASVLDKELQTANERIDSLQKLIQRLHNGEEIASMKAQLTQKNQLLTKVKILLEKAAAREKELIDKVNDLQRINPSSFK